MWIRPRLSMKPSEFFARQGHVTFTDDPVALKTLLFIGADCLLWGSDYPHDEGSFPHSQEVIERTFAGLSETDKRKIVWDNTVDQHSFPCHRDQRRHGDQIYVSPVPIPQVIATHLG